MPDLSRVFSARLHRNFTLGGKRGSLQSRQSNSAGALTRILATSREKGESGPLTLGQALAAHVRLIVWCRRCNHRADPDIAVQVAQHGPLLPVLDWARLLRCMECGARDTDFVVTGERR